jgi:hypothetical protein
MTNTCDDSAACPQRRRAFGGQARRLSIWPMSLRAGWTLSLSKASRHGGMAAGMLLVTEAGGRTADIFEEGSPLITNRLAAANGHLLPALLGVLSDQI